MFIVCPLGLHFQNAALNAPISRNRTCPYTLGIMILRTGYLSERPTLKSTLAEPWLSSSPAYAAFSPSTMVMRACFQNGIHLELFSAQTLLKNKQNPQHNSTQGSDYDGLPTAKSRRCSISAQHLTSRGTESS